MLQKIKFFINLLSVSNNIAEAEKSFPKYLFKEKDIYCIIYDGAIDTHVFKNHMKYHSTLDGLKVYKINNFIMDNPDAYPNIIAKVT